MTQTWDPKTYSQNGAFVHGLAGGVLEWLAAKPGESILDLGCGDGQLTERVALSGANVVGLRRKWFELYVSGESRRSKRAPKRCPSTAAPSTPFSRTQRCIGCAITTQ
jgi:SAM-dependent methyltransferase